MQISVMKLFLLILLFYLYMKPKDFFPSMSSNKDRKKINENAHSNIVILTKDIAL